MIILAKNQVDRCLRKVLKEIKQIKRIYTSAFLSNAFWRHTAT